MGWMISRQADKAFPLSALLPMGKKAASTLALGVVLGPVLGVMPGPIFNPPLAMANDGEEAPTSASSRFTCEIQAGEYTVMYHPKSEPGQAYPWAVPAEMGGGWTPELRCETISARLEEYRPDGLVELRTATENGYDTICATTEENLDDCRIVFTVPPGQDPVATRNAVFSNITLADAGTDTNAVNTLVGGTRWPDTDLSDSGLLGAGNVNSEIFGAVEEILGGRSTRPTTNAIYLKPYLDPSDGGTGLYLDQSGQPLNPDNFR
ncbi:COP23 domain-containing protein [Leptothoe sp. PORK10 BA2]|uniref:COP23 domain-containing protein n=1 Tax=Leptothoe sp. PORK10 BA2 TaxID=3110254 RepID=UPI002B214572|nr:COP23 domain-containing protein [Leptothoe sp. PORK10 BA2]MEA5465739.1 COP23 domain-containing protein [Leptothoe sp. PORK10 BA2]